MSKVFMTFREGRKVLQKTSADLNKVECVAMGNNFLSEHERTKNRLKLREGKSAFFNAKLYGRAVRIQLEPIYKQNY